MNPPPTEHDAAACCVEENVQPGSDSEIISRALSLFAKDRVLEAYDLLVERFGDDFRNVVSDPSEEEIIGIIYKDGALARMLLREFKSTEGWKACVDKDRTKTFYKKSQAITMKDHANATTAVHDEGAPLHVIKIEGHIDSPVFNLMSILYEVDLYGVWVPQLKQCGVVKYLGGSHDRGLSKFRFLSYFSFNLPWPLSSRDCLTYAFVADMSDDREDPSILVVIRGADKNHDSSESDTITKYDNSEFVRVGIEYSGFLIRMTSENTCHLSLIASVDPKVAYVPYWFQNWLTTNMSFLMMTKLRSACDMVPNSEYSERIKNNKDVYDEITKRLCQFLPKKD